jgi:hypothetical protein
MLNLKSFLAALLATSSLVGVNRAEAAYRANYEAALVSQDGSRVIRTAEFVSSGAPLAQALEKYQLVLVPTISSDGSYTIAISLAPESSTDPQPDQDANHSFSGKIGTPLEIETTIDGVAISLAFMLYEARE